MKVFFVFIILISATVCATELQNRESMNIHSATLWQLIERLIDHPSFTLDTIRQVLPVEFLKNGDNGYSSFHESKPLHLIDQVVIETAILSIKHKDGVSRLIGLDLDPAGACVTLDEVLMHYPDIKPIGAPRGDSLDEMTTWGTQQLWGKLVFGFKERNPRCLAHVGIDRIKPIFAPTG